MLLNLQCIAVGLARSFIDEGIVVIAVVIEREGVGSEMTRHSTVHSQITFLKYWLCKLCGCCAA